MKEQPEQKKRKPSNYYVDNQELHRELDAYATRMRREMEEAAACGENPKKVPKTMNTKLVLMLERIIKGLGSSHNFRGYMYLDDMKAEAMLNLVNYADRYDSSKTTNALGYVTQIVWRSFTKYIQKEKKQLASKLHVIRDSHGWMTENTEDWLGSYEKSDAAAAG